MEGPGAEEVPGQKRTPEHLQEAAQERLVAPLLASSSKGCCPGLQRVQRDFLRIDQILIV